MNEFLKLSSIQHQPRAISLIRRALHSGRSHHAYLFDGPQGVGKALTGRALAASLLCLSRMSVADVSSSARTLTADASADADACGQCPSCKLLANDNHPDFHLIHRGLHKHHPDPNLRRSKGLFLSVDVIRHFLLDRSALSPTVSNARVFLIDAAERMNDAAQNALLKTLEEPPGKSRLILVTSSASRLLPTIRSRCQRIPFGPLPLDFVEQSLRSSGLDSAAAHALARLSDGRLGVALEWRRVNLLDTAQKVRQCLADYCGIHTPSSSEVAPVRTPPPSVGPTTRSAHARELPQPDPEAFAKCLIGLAEELAARTTTGQPPPADDSTESDDLDDDPAESDTEPGAARAADRPGRGGKSASTDELRSALKLLLLLIGAIYRDQLIEATCEALSPLAIFGRQATSAPTETADFTDLADCVEAVAQAEMMLDRNVAPQLVCERLNAALTATVNAL